MSRRVDRAQDLVREEVSRLLLYRIKDPRLAGISVTGVKMTADLRQALIFYSHYDDQCDRKAMQQGLERAAGFIRREIGRAVALKYVPEIKFEFDDSLQYAQHMEKVLQDLKEPEGDEGDRNAS